MKAGIITAAGNPPAYGDFREPVASEGKEIIFVRASALSQFSKSRSSGFHYSSEGVFPSVAGAEGVGQTPDGRRVYFALPEAPFGALAERSLVRSKQCVAVPDGLDDQTAAAIANPGMSAWAALVERAKLQPGETVMVNGATGSAGRLAVQLAKHLGAGKVIGTGRNEVELKELLSLGADVIIPLTLGATQYEEALIAQFSASTWWSTTCGAKARGQRSSLSPKLRRTQGPSASYTLAGQAASKISSYQVLRCVRRPFS